jgi:hypothetical protein
MTARPAAAPAFVRAARRAIGTPMTLLALIEWNTSSAHASFIRAYSLPYRLIVALMRRLVALENYRYCVILRRDE